MDSILPSRRSVLVNASLPHGDAIPFSPPHVTAGLSVADAPRPGLLGWLRGPAPIADTTFCVRGVHHPRVSELVSVAEHTATLWVRPRSGAVGGAVEEDAPPGASRIRFGFVGPDGLWWEGRHNSQDLTAVRSPWTLALGQMAHLFSGMYDGLPADQVAVLVDHCVIQVRGTGRTWVEVVICWSMDSE